MIDSLAIRFAPAGRAATGVACIGDSITEGSGGATPYPTYLRPLLGVAPRDWPVTNFGSAGKTAANIRDQQWTLLVKGLGYWRVVVLGGVNDINNGDTAVNAFAALTTIYDEAEARGLTVTPILLTPWKGFAAWSVPKQTETDALNTSILARYPAAVSPYPSFETVAGSDILKASFDGGDGLHPNSAGNSALATLIAAAIP